MAVAELLTCAVAARPCDNRRCGSRRRAACRFVSSVAGLLSAVQPSRGCVSTAAWPSSGCLPVQPPPGCVTTVIVVAVAWPSLGCLPVQPLPGCDNRRCGSRCRAACRFASAVAWPHRQPSPGFVSTGAEVLSSTSAKLRGSRANRPVAQRHAPRQVAVFILFVSSWTVH